MLSDYLTRAQAAEYLDVSRKRVSDIAKRDNWTIQAVGRSHLYPKEDVQRTAEKMEAQKAWRLLSIPFTFWGAWWLADMDGIITLPCPQCGKTAYQPAGQHPQGYNDRAACPSCQHIFVPQGYASE